jgi:hypothetical protein
VANSLIIRTDPNHCKKLKPGLKGIQIHRKEKVLALKGKNRYKRYDTNSRIWGLQHFY